VDFFFEFGAALWVGDFEWSWEEEKREGLIGGAAGGLDFYEEAEEGVGKEVVSIIPLSSEKLKRKGRDKAATLKNQVPTA